MVFDICILEHANDRKLWLVDRNAFTWAAGVTFSTKKLRSYLESRVIFSDGSLKKIISIKKSSICGSSRWDKIKNIMSGVYDIEVEFEFVSVLKIEEIKEFIIDSINSNKSRYSNEHFFF